MSFPHDHGKRAERAASESTIRCDLQQAIGDCSIPPDMFVSRESLEQIWSQARVDEFIRALDPTVHPSHVPLIRCKFLQTISILVYMQWDNWSRFNEIFLSHTDGCGRQDRTDDNIPEYTLETLKSSTFLGPAAGIKFFYDQYIFCPIDIVVGTSIVRSEEWRLPFLRDKSARLGRREYGHTTREMIPGSHLLVSKGVCSPTAVVVAQKVSASKKATRRETRSLNMIREILSRHDRVALHLAIITIGNDVHILPPMADMNLEKFLLFQLHQYEITELLQEAANLANALEYLHNRLQAGVQVYFYHRDLKPSKILIYSISPSSEYHRVGRWKITDFDLSVVKKPEGHLPVKGFVTRTTNQQSWIPGPYQAPEVCVNDGADFRSNIWSFGCILVRLLSSKLDGARGLMWLDELRCKDVDKVSAYEHDYFYRGDPPNLNPHIKEWINNLPRRTGGYNEEFLSCCRDFLLSTLKVDKYERSSAESVARQLQQLTKLLMPRPDPLFDPEIYSNDSVYDESSRHLLHTSGFSGQVVTEDPTFCGYTPGPQPVTGSKSASVCRPHNPKHKAHVTQPADRWDWVEKLQTFGYNTQEINDILLERARDAPWIYFEPEKFRLSRMSTTQHIPRCCHSLGESRQQGSTSDSMDTLQRGIDLEVNSYVTVKQVEELCGLCCISPKTRITTDWLGSASFTEGNTAMAVTYSLPTDKRYETRASTIIGRCLCSQYSWTDCRYWQLSGCQEGPYAGYHTTSTAIIRGILVGSRQLNEAMNTATEINNLHPVIESRVWKFSDLPNAYKDCVKGDHLGKVVVDYD
ncbi:kinase-like domain-containing protein [Aspergillus novoparasiticus]|uniref:non-specific serine/threonine protein kinase n=1 Tax=Aspergillus novoparasiticus TaxID=986946 RepID=A0A5N6EPQ3_9EURO|nr:kinase-like domain-containing protein [Aspergillus novoparasiticus]